MTDDAISERDGPTLEEMEQDAEVWRTTLMGNPQACRHCGHMGGTMPSDHQLRQFYAYLLAGGEKQAAHDLGVAYQTLKNNLSHLYKRVGTTNAVQTAYLLGRGAWDKPKP